MTALIRRLFQPRPDSCHLTFTVYTREACGCCEKAMAILKHYQSKHSFSIETIDVDSDSALAAEFGSSVPVVTLNGKVRFRGVVNPVLLERLLSAPD